MDKLTSLYKKYDLFAHYRLRIPRKSRMDVVSAWQAVFFKKIFLLLLPVSILLFVPGFIMSLMGELYLLALFDSIALLLLLFAFFGTNLKLKTRKIIVLIDFYLLGIILLIFLGWSGPGLLYLLSVSVFATLILNKNAGFATLGSNFLMFLLFVLYVNKWPILIGALDSGGTFAVGINFILFNGLLVFAVSSLMDVLKSALIKEKKTRQKLEEEVVMHKMAREKAVESDRLKSIFLANVSHEIRTPMNGILGFTDLLKNPKLTIVQQQQFIEIIQKSGERMLSTITDLINMSIIESGQVEMHIVPTNLKKLMEELVSFFRGEAENKGLEFKSNCDLREDNLIFYTDDQKLYAILSNLLKNAIKYTKTGSVELQCKCSNEEVIFTVIDTGTGIPEDKKDVIFNRFTQAHAHESGEYEGSGLGLSIAKAYTEILHGCISFNSKTGRGTTFELKIPVEKEMLTRITD